MKLSTRGLEHLEQIEGRRGKVYLDSGGAATIGIGHLLTEKELIKGSIRINNKEVTYKKGISDEEIDALCLQDVAEAEQTINRVVKVELNQNQYDALVSFVFNIGSRQFTQGGFAGSHCRVLKLINTNQYTLAADRMQDWNKDNGVIVQGLVNRRRAERELFNKEIV